ISSDSGGKRLEREEGLVDHDILFKANIAGRHGQGQAAASELLRIFQPVDAQEDQPLLAPGPGLAEIGEIAALDEDIETLVETLAGKAKSEIELALGLDKRGVRDMEGRPRID